MEDWQEVEVTFRFSYNFGENTLPIEDWKWYEVLTSTKHVTSERIRDLKVEFGQKPVPAHLRNRVNGLVDLGEY